MQYYNHELVDNDAAFHHTSHMAKSYRPKIRRCYSVLEAETAAAEEAVIALGRQIASLIKEEGARP